MESIRYFAASVSVLGAFIIYVSIRLNWRSDSLLVPAWVIATLTSLSLAWLLTGDTGGLSILAALLLIAGALVKRFLPVVTVSGHGLIFSAIAIALAMATWTSELTRSFGWPAWIQNTALGAQAIVFFYTFLVSIPFKLLSLGELGFDQRLRDAMYSTIATRRGKRFPKVCIQVPCYSEPPEIVIATLNAIAKVTYPNFEVIVIDNNTKDPALWMPLEAHCKVLGKRFRFYHVDQLAGAKAGALNFLSRNAAIDAELIAVVDADYIVEPDYLDKWTPLFEDPQFAFVQTTHEYRDWEGSGFLSRFYPGYVCAHKLMFPSLSLVGAEFTVGTMCVIRRSALEEVGGWAEWCQTEDSELAIRLHAQGYRGFYFSDVSGRGLIPDTLDAMRKQRFRWAYGPMQQLKKHWRLYLGRSKSGKLTIMQRYFELAHSLEHTPEIVAVLVNLPIWYAVYQEVFRGSASVVGMDYIIFFLAVVFKRRMSVWINLKQVGRGTLADFLLNPAVTVAIKVYEMKGSLCAMLGLNWPWVRTDKFPTAGSFRGAAAITRTDMLAFVSCVLISLLLLPFAKFWPLNYSGMMCLLSAMTGTHFLIAIVLCYWREFELLARKEPAHPIGVAAPETMN